MPSRRSSGRRSVKKQNGLRRNLSVIGEDSKNNDVQPTMNIIDDQKERSEFVFELVNNWISNADAKVGVSCASFTAVYAIVANVIENNPWFSVSRCSVTISEKSYFVCFALSFCFMVLAILFYLLAVFPDLRSSGKKKGDKVYPVFYKDIAKKKDPEVYQELMKNGNDCLFVEEIIKETFMNSKICYKKFRLYRIAVLFSICAIMLLSASVFCYHLFSFV